MPKTPEVDGGLIQITGSGPPSILKSPERIVLLLAARRVQWRCEREAPADITEQVFTTQHLYSVLCPPRPGWKSRGFISHPRRRLPSVSRSSHFLSPHPPSLALFLPPLPINLNRLLVLTAAIRRTVSTSTLEEENTQAGWC